MILAKPAICQETRLLEAGTENCRWSRKSPVKGEGSSVRGGRAESEHWNKSLCWQVAHGLLRAALWTGAGICGRCTPHVPLRPSTHRPQTYVGAKGGCSSRARSAEQESPRRESRARAQGRRGEGRHLPGGKGRSNAASGRALLRGSGQRGRDAPRGEGRPTGEGRRNRGGTPPKREGTPPALQVPHASLGPPRPACPFPSRRK